MWDVKVMTLLILMLFFCFCLFFFQAEDGIRDRDVTWSSDVCSSDLCVVSWSKY